LYLWHWPLLVFWKYLQPQPALTVWSKLAIVAMSFVAASASYYLVETPIRARRMLKSSQVLVWSSVAASLAFLTLGTAIGRQHGVPSRLPPNCVRLASADVDPLLFAQTSLEDLRRDAVPILTGREPSSGTQPVDILLWGDSHANSVAPAIRAFAADRRLTSAMIVHPATAPLLDFWRAFPYALTGNDALEFTTRAIEYVRRHAVKRVVLAAAWEAYAFEADGGRQTTATQESSLRTFRQKLAQTVEGIQTAGADVWLLKDVPSMPFDVPRALSRVCITRGNIAALKPSAHVYIAEHAVINNVIDSLRSSRTHIIDPIPLFTDAGDRLVMETESHALFMDNSHLTVQGARLLRPLFKSVVAPLER
jgi:hypothetical protein